jgi:hypothetical protein
VLNRESYRIQTSYSESLSPAITRAERASDAMGKGDRREGKRMASDCYACAGFHGGDIELSVGYG